ncbi:spore germination protein GerQC [Bacillus sp. JCM 19046]|nr:spore germination protein GerQC [Bacillus sp. JCM 19045]GAF19556.1 spore germination protein GerQC [Bacillus sp. JCM 19046]
MGKIIKNSLISILILIPLLTSTRTNIIDELQLITVAGFDQVEDNKVRGTVTLTAYSYEEELNNTALSAISTSTRQLRLRLNSMSSRPIHGGKISSIVIQDHLAEDGIFDLLDTYYRDPTIALRAFLSVTRGSTYEMLNKEFPLQTEIGTYLKDMLDHNMERGNLPKSNMHLFMRAYFEKGHDPFMPILSYTNNVLQVDGTALFKDDRFVHALDIEEAFFLKLIKDGYQTGGVIELKVDNESEVAVLREMRSSSELSVDRESESLHIEIELKTRLSEYSGHTLNEAKLKEITQESDRVIEEGIRNLINVMQEKQIDPIGFGAREINRSELNEAEWYDLYGKLNVKVNVKTSIVESGVSQ